MLKKNENQIIRQIHAAVLPQSIDLYLYNILPPNMYTFKSTLLIPFTDDTCIPLSKNLLHLVLHQIKTHLKRIRVLNL